MVQEDKSGCTGDKQKMTLFLDCRDYDCSKFIIFLQWYARQACICHRNVRERIGL